MTMNYLCRIAKQYEQVEPLSTKKIENLEGANLEVPNTNPLDFNGKRYVIRARGTIKERLALNSFARILRVRDNVQVLCAPNSKHSLVSEVVNNEVNFRQLQLQPKLEIKTLQAEESLLETLRMKSLSCDYIVEFSVKGVFGIAPLRDLYMHREIAASKIILKPSRDDRSLITEAAHAVVGDSPTQKEKRTHSIFLAIVDPAMNGQMDSLNAAVDLAKSNDLVIVYVLCNTKRAALMRAPLLAAYISDLPEGGRVLNIQHKVTTYEGPLLKKILDLEEELKPDFLCMNVDQIDAFKEGRQMHPGHSVVDKLILNSTSSLVMVMPRPAIEDLKTTRISASREKGEQLAEQRDLLLTYRKTKHKEAGRFKEKYRFYKRMEQKKYLRR